MTPRKPSPARSQGAVRTPIRQKHRRTLSVSSARSNATGILAALVNQRRHLNMDSFVLSPLGSRTSILSDNTDIEEPRRKSWWKNLAENSRDVVELFEENKIAEPNNIIEELDMEVLSQENKKNNTLELPESSENESINSIVIPQRKLFIQKENQQQKTFAQLLGPRESLAKLHKAGGDKTLNAGTRELFQNKHRSQPIFPAALLNISPNKTAADKMKEFAAAVPKGQIRNIFGNCASKRKNIFTNFIVSESEDDISEIQPKVFGFQKKIESRRRSSRGMRDPSPTSSITTDMEMDDWRMLPSSTMVENQLEVMIAGHTPKRPRLSKLTEIESQASSNKSSSSKESRNSKPFTKRMPHDIVEEEILEKDDVRSRKSKIFTKEKASDDIEEEIFLENDNVDTGKDTEKSRKSKTFTKEKKEAVSMTTRNKSKILLDDTDVKNKSPKDIDKSRKSKTFVKDKADLETSMTTRNKSTILQDNDQNKSKPKVTEHNTSMKTRSQSKNSSLNNRQIIEEVNIKSTTNDADEVDNVEQETSNDSKDKCQDISQDDKDENDEQNEQEFIQDEISNASDNEEEHQSQEAESSQEIEDENDENEEENEDQNGSELIQDEIVDDSHYEEKDQSLEAEISQEVADEIEDDVEEAIEQDSDAEENESGIQDSEEQIESENEEENDDIVETSNENDNNADNIHKNQDIENEEESAEDEVMETTNVSYDTTGRNRNKNESPEAVLNDIDNIKDSFAVKRRNTSVRKTEMLKTIYPDLVPVRESTGFSDGTSNSSGQGSGWDSHRTTRKTLRQTYGREFTPRKSLRALVMEKSAKRKTQHNELASVTAPFPQANSTEVPSIRYEDDDENDENQTPKEVSPRTRQIALEKYLQEVKKKNTEERLKVEEAVRNLLNAPSNTTKKIHLFKVPAQPLFARKTAPKPKKNAKFTSIFGELPTEIIEDMKYKPPKRFQARDAPWITKYLYKFLEGKLKAKYDYKARVRAEKLVENVYYFVKDLRRRDVATSESVHALKREMARLDVVQTHFDFYEFFREFMPRDVRIKVIPDVVNKISLPRNGVFADIL